MLSFEFPTVVAVIVTFAAVLYIMEQLSVMINRDRGTRLRRIMTKFEKIHDDATKEIDDVSFDLYWSGIVDDVKYQLREHVVIPQEMREMLPLEAIDSLLEPQVQQIRHLSRHLAIHARINGKDREYINGLPKVLRKGLTEVLEEHEKDLEGDRTTLISVGVDTNALEAHFSSE